MNKVNLEEGLSRFDDLWRPKIIADLNDYKVQRSRPKESGSGTTMTTPTSSFS
jgi:hypothetical protein